MVLSQANRKSTVAIRRLHSLTLILRTRRHNLHLYTALPYSHCCGMGGRRHAQTESKTKLSSSSASAAGFGSFQVAGAQQPQVTGFAPCLRIRDRSVHSL